MLRRAAEGHHPCPEASLSSPYRHLPTPSEVAKVPGAWQDAGGLRGKPVTLHLGGSEQFPPCWKLTPVKKIVAEACSSVCAREGNRASQEGCADPFPCVTWDKLIGLFNKSSYLSGHGFWG